MNMCQKGVIFGLTCGFIAGLAIGFIIDNNTEKKEV